MDGGSALIPLHVRSPTPADRIGQIRTAAAEDGAELRYSFVSEERDETLWTQTSVLRYERHRDGESTVVERPWLLQWYTRSDFEELAAAAGLTTVMVGVFDRGPGGEAGAALPPGSADSGWCAGRCPR